MLLVADSQHLMLFNERGTWVERRVCISIALFFRGALQLLTVWYLSNSYTKALLNAKAVLFYFNSNFYVPWKPGKYTFMFTYMHICFLPPLMESYLVFHSSTTIHCKYSWLQQLLSSPSVHYTQMEGALPHRSLGITLYTLWRTISHCSNSQSFTKAVKFHSSVY